MLELIEAENSSSNTYVTYELMDPMLQTTVALVLPQKAINKMCLRRAKRKSHRLTCDVEILDWSCRPVRSEDDTLAGAPRCKRMLTFLSRSAREIARGEVFPEMKKK